MRKNAKSIHKKLNSSNAEPEAKRPSEISEEGGHRKLLDVRLRYFYLLIKCESNQGAP